MSRHHVLPSILAGAALALAVASAPAATSRNVQVLANMNEYPTPPGTQPYAYSACWAYVHPDGREYALLGVASGTAIYNIVNPAAPYRVAFIPGPPSVWREMKSYRNWAYVTTEAAGTGQGLQIIRMTDPEHPVLAATYTTGFVRSHTVQVDTARALLVCNGTRDQFGQPAGMRILSLANPEAPVELGRWPANPLIPSSVYYVHDCMFRGNNLYASSIYSGTERVLDLTTPSNPIEVRNFTYPDWYYTHSAWPDSTGQWLYVCDEHNGQTLRVIDPSQSGTATVANELTSNPVTIVHNPRVKGHDLYLANYTEGIRVLDLTDPLRPAEYAWLDTYGGVSGGYGGVWEVCPYFPSGTVIASDMENGLWVFRPIRTYGRIRVDVVGAEVEGGPEVPHAGAVIHVDPLGDSLVTTALGSQSFAPNPGTYTVRASAYGHSGDSQVVTIAAGEFKTVTLHLVELERVPFSGQVRDLSSSAPLSDAELALEYGPLAATTGASGTFQIDDVPADLYRIEVRRAGYAPYIEARSIGPSWTSEDFALLPAHQWDPLATGAGWITFTPPGVQGGWVLGKPVVNGAADPVMAPIPGAPAARQPRPIGPFDVQHEEPPAVAPTGSAPRTDHSPNPDSTCFITGQAPDTSQLSVNGLQGGTTTLTSPEFDITGMNEPMVGLWRWFYSWNAGTGQPDPGDWLAIQISHNGGTTWTTMDSVSGSHEAWEEAEYRVADYVPATTHVRLRLIAAEQGAPSTARMALDDVITYDAQAVLAVSPGAALRLRLGPAWPNPSASTVRFMLEAPAAGRLRLRIVDVAGRLVRELHDGPLTAGAHPFLWDGADARGRNVRPGIYFVRALLGGTEVGARIVRVR